MHSVVSFINSLYGIDDFDAFEWVVIVVNFTNIYERVCNDADYYDWTPFDEVRTYNIMQLVSCVTIYSALTQGVCWGHQ